MPPGAVARVRGIHRRLGSTEETTGRTYRVDDPDLLLWVHCCEVDSLLVAARRGGLIRGPPWYPGLTATRHDECH